MKNGVVIGRGWTQPGGRPHAEAVALDLAGDAAHGATLYTTLEPCAHRSQRGPACADRIVAARLARVVIGMGDPDTRTAGKGAARMREAGVAVTEANLPADDLALSGHACAVIRKRPHVTLKLAMTIDGCIALNDGSSRWITSEVARAHTHRERARSDAILVGGTTLRVDNPSLDVRLAGLDNRSPTRWVLTRSPAPDGWQALASPGDISRMDAVRYLFVEGGAGAAAAFLQADLVDRLLVYRAPIIAGNARSAVSDIGLADLDAAHGRWRLDDTRRLGSDLLEDYSRTCDKKGNI